MSDSNRMRSLIAGNWKMHHRGMLAPVAALKHALKDKPASCDVAVCPPATLIAAVAGELAGSKIVTGGQDCHPEPFGAFTGDISAEALRDAGAGLVILGHSERRHGHGETDELIARKAAAAQRAGLTAIICVGETEVERDGGSALRVVSRQAAGSIPQGYPASSLVIAYEPVWAIGTGRTPNGADIEAMHSFIRAEIVKRLGDAASSVPILYGGSVKPSNAAEILALKEVGGALVGGASLKFEEFMPIIRAHESYFGSAAPPP
jgi:triosephosphate isomerase (TIM)